MSKNDNWHIVSLVMYCQPDQLATTKQTLAQMPDIEVHTDDGNAKLVITIEGANTGFLTEQMDGLRDLPGCLSLQMVFHQEDVPPEPTATPTNSEFYNASMM